jgi:hypothetical protein
MKWISCVIIFSCLGPRGYAQVDLQAMLEQISALQGYISTAEKGYKIAEEGLQTIGQIKNGEFNLHSVFFSSLAAVNPQIKQMAQAAEIIAIQISIAEQVSNALQANKSNKWLQPGEISYINGVYAKLLSAAVNDVNDLIMVITDGKLTMSDGERISRIQAIDNNARSQSLLVQDFSKQTSLLASQRQLESSDVESIENLYGIPNE